MKESEGDLPFIHGHVALVLLIIVSIAEYGDLVDPCAGDRGGLEQI